MLLALNNNQINNAVRHQFSQNKLDKVYIYLVYIDGAVYNHR